MAVYVKNGSAVFFGVDDVFVPNLVIQGAGHGVFLLSNRLFYAGAFC
jgi:hypothetical protein